MLLHSKAYSGGKTSCFLLVTVKLLRREPGRQGDMGAIGPPFAGYTRPFEGFCQLILGSFEIFVQLHINKENAPAKRT